MRNFQRIKIFQWFVLSVLLITMSPYSNCSKTDFSDSKNSTSSGDTTGNDNPQNNGDGHEENPLEGDNGGGNPEIPFMGYPYIHITFQATNNGNSVTDLDHSQLCIQEDGKQVTEFEFIKRINSNNLTTQGERPADIVVALDTSSSMNINEDIISAVKSYFQSFVTQINLNNKIARYHLITFGDEIRSQSKILSEVSFINSSDFLSEINSNLTVPHNTLVGDNTDQPENQLLALQKAYELHNIQTNSNARRFIFIITNSEFHYLGDSLNGGLATPFGIPAYDTVLNQLNSKNISVFIIAPRHKGYDRYFQSFPSLSYGTNGRFFSVRDLLASPPIISIDTAFSEVISSISADYEVSYSAKNNNLPGSEKPITGRNILFSNQPCGGSNNYSFSILSKSIEMRATP